ncbi:tetraacyldisaccharide 4'-kinase [uncultured Acidaminococcus sp.]|uniref:tetraacyldisaccharide 4'-kinase n=1 Tax=uncultured Acidaminococcus sp. TaxID=352152 RepID=UPI00266EF135|nr:tetraacyldisaccharide 4'-kinase [uncultured Acidaminococcus sp.]
MYYIYNFLATVLFIFVILPYFTWRYFREKGFPRRFRQSLGFIRDEEIAAVAHKNCIWIHGASVGEIVATSPLVKEIRKAMPDAKILVSAVTTGGYNMAHQIIPEADAIIYFPLDLPFVSESFVKRIMPRIFMPVETELWPNFLRAIKLRRIPVMMVNGRISDKSVKSYRYLFGILADMMGSVTRFCMQSSIDAEYIQHLGAEKRRIFVTGNTKFDQTYAEVTPEDLQQYKDELGLEEDYPVIVAGSTHPTEEETLFQSFLDIRKEFPQSRLIIAPRKPGRIHEITRLAEKYGLSLGLRSSLKAMSNPRPKYQVVLIDTIGELGRIYAVGDAVFVGGSLINHGGHNVLEPAAHAKPIIVGPSMSNFKDSFALLSKVGACVQIHDGKEMTDMFLKIFKDDALRKKMGDASLQVIRENRGAAVRTIGYLKELLELTATESMVNTHYKINTRNINDEVSPRMRPGDAVTQYLIQLSHGEDNGILDWCVLAFLRILSVLYEAGVRLKLFCYNAGLVPRTKLDCCVISIGNITVGGTGKTPTAQKVALMIQKLGYRVVILNRGYRSHWEEKIGVVSDGKKIYMTAYEAGDEAFLMAKQLPGIPVVIGKERAITGQFAVDKFKAEVIILDDGYQHWQLYRDLDVVLVDTLNMFGNGCILPRGTLREPLSNLSRAGLFLLTKCDQSSPISRATLCDTLHKYAPAAPIAESIHKPCDYIEIADWYKNDMSKALPLEALRGKHVMVFSAIGNPSSFEQTMNAEGLNIVEAIRYPDHHDYGMVEMQYIMDRAISRGVKALVTTGKDAVKIPTEFIYLHRDVPLYILDMEIQITSGEEAFTDTIKAAIKKENPSK